MHIVVKHNEPRKPGLRRVPQGLLESVYRLCPEPGEIAEATDRASLSITF